MTTSRTLRGGAIAGATAVLGLTMLAAPPSQAAASTSLCSNVITVVVRGSDEAAGTTNTATTNTALYAYRTGMGRPGPVAGDLQTVSKKTVYIAGLKYAAAIGWIGLAYNNSRHGGVVALQKSLNYLATKCPNSKTALIGFSQGAHVIGDALSASSGVRPNATARGKIAAVVLYGDPMYNPTEPFVATKGLTKFGMLGTRATGDLKAFEGRLRSYCYAGDPACQGSSKRGGKNLTALDNNPTGLTIHRSYFTARSTPRVGGVNFIAGKTG